MPKVQTKSMDLESKKKEGMAKEKGEDLTIYNKELCRIGIVMGSLSDKKVMENAVEILKKFDIDYEFTIVSAHRTPERMFEYSQNARSRGIRVIIAGAGGAAHLPGMIASLTTLPVIGVPILSSNSLDGWDSLLSIVQMPAGVPVATVAIGGAKNAGILAIEILGTFIPEIANKLEKYKLDLRNSVLDSIKDLMNP